ncbi:MAG: hypothetical protein ACPW60_12295 [Methylohalobius sp. ZOD2]
MERASTHSYDFYVTDALPIDVEALFERDRLQADQLTDRERADQAELDEILLEEALGPAPLNVTERLLEDHPDQPVERWWWHLGALRRGEYPIDRLPDHLMNIYRTARAA